MRITLYRIEREDLGKEVTLYPHIPENIIDHFEDETTPRVCACLTLYGCILAAECHCNIGLYRELWAYSTTIDTEEYDVYCPTIDELIDVKLTGEFWIKKPVIFTRMTDEPFHLQYQMPIDDQFSFIVRDITPFFRGFKS